MNITRAQYDALIEAALAGDLEEVRRIQEIVDRDNEIQRYVLYIRWQDIGGTPPRNIELGRPWPPELTTQIELDRPISKEDVLDLVRSRATNPASIMVTPDRAGIVGWSQVDVYFGET